MVLVTLLIALSACKKPNFTEINKPAPIYSKQNNKSAKENSKSESQVIQEQEKGIQTYPYQESSSPNANTRFFTPEKPLSPAVVSLLSQADQSYKTGDYDLSVATIERALRIEPRNATLVYKLAAVRLKQSKPRLAEDLAKKAALLSGSNTMLKKRSWLLIAEARKMQGNQFGASEAIRKASQY